MNLLQIEEELRLIAGELQGHDDLDQWMHLEHLADELGKQTGFIRARANKLARQALPFGGLEEEIAEGWYG